MTEIINLDESPATSYGISGRDPYEVHDVLPDALADCGTLIPDADAAAAQVVFTRLARMHLEGRAGEKWIMDKVDEIVAWSGYADTVMSLPLGQLYALADEWDGGLGRIEQELKAEIHQACAAQLAASPSLATPLPDSTGPDESTPKSG